MHSGAAAAAAARRDDANNRQTDCCTRTNLHETRRGVQRGKRGGGGGGGGSSGFLLDQTLTHRHRFTVSPKHMHKHDIVLIAQHISDSITNYCKMTAIYICTLTGAVCYCNR